MGADWRFFTAILAGGFTLVAWTISSTVGGLRGEMNTKFDSVDNQFVSLRVEMNAKFEAINSKFDAMNI